MGRATLLAGILGASVGVAISCGQVGRIDSFAADHLLRSFDGTEQLSRVFVTPLATRMETAASEPGGSVVVITRHDLDVVWTLLPAQRCYHETAVEEFSAPLLLREDTCAQVIGELGCEAIDGYLGRKVLVRSTAFLPGHTRTTSAVCWLADAFRHPLRIDLDDGSTMALHNIVPGPQAADLFSVPAGYSRVEPENPRSWSTMRSFGNTPGRAARSRCRIHGGTEPHVAAQRDIQRGAMSVHNQIACILP